MTPTDEEAELARVIYQATGGEITQGEWDEHVASYRRLCAQWPGYASGAGMVCDAMKRARAILAAGYVKRNDALEEAAKELEASAEIFSSWDKQLYLRRAAARIRALPKGQDMTWTKAAVEQFCEIWRTHDSF